jgi:hypothetical protein
MATAVVSIICIAMIVLGGMTMSHGIVTSADSAAFSIEEISVREGEMMRTEIDTLRAAPLSWSDLLRVQVDNSGGTKLSSFNKWDLIVHYYDSGGNYYTEWLPYASGALGDNEWQKATIWLNGQPEFFEPGIMNPEEELVILAKLDPLPGDATKGDVIIATPNGICKSISFNSLGYTLLTPHSENMTIASTRYYELVEATPADGAAITETTYNIGRGITGSWLLHNEADDNRPARHLYPLTGINQIPAATWTVYYHGFADGNWRFPQFGYASLSIDIIIRQADGGIREVIADDVAEATFTTEQSWVTISEDYNFPGYTVVDDTDYLEIDYYGKSNGLGPWWSNDNYIQLRIDDNTLDETEQTRIVA